MPQLTALPHVRTNNALPASPPDVTIKIGEFAVGLDAWDAAFGKILKARYAGYLETEADPWLRFNVKIVPPGGQIAKDELEVRKQAHAWLVDRGDFSACWNPQTRRGQLRQSANPYSLDTLLRIVHSIALAENGGFLLHAASAVRHGRAYVFSGVSGAGKTTLSRLAPPDVQVLSDEISYVMRDGGIYRAYGTPFSGELASAGENISAPIAGLFFLVKSRANGLVQVGPAAALRALLRNILFLAQEPELVEQVFDSALHFVSGVPIRRMQFTPDARAWELIP
ncbi:MAG TPA: hypothetical protein VNB49_05930 [Candidatus Dormibacteraeota bacterium]|nr:hypothetical protein [Candidatus Dormibacteraeota bacterium]